MHKLNHLKIKVILPVLLALVGNISRAQIPAPYLSNHLDLNAADTQRVGLSLFMNNYFKNNEYFGPIYHGYTLFGTLFRPAITYTPRSFLRLEGGVFMQQDMGTDGFTELRPFFSVKIQKNSHAFIFGNLEGGAQHNMIAPLLDPERCLKHPFENGLQYRVNSKRVLSDAWIDWVRAEDLTAKKQELIEAGISFSYYAVKREKFALSIPLQGAVWHLGGQLNEAADPIETIGNGAAGIRLESQGSGSLLKKWTLESFVLNYIHSSHTELRRYPDGHGFFSGLFAESKYGFFLSAQYFFGYHYITGTGAPLFQSVSTHYTSYYENYRNLISCTGGFRKELFPGMWIDIRMEPYLDLGGNFWEYSYSGFITYKHDFKLKKLR